MVLEADEPGTARQDGPDVNNLTEPEYWNAGYQRVDRGCTLPELANFRCLSEKRVLDAIESLPLAGKRVLELGAGDSTMLLTLGRRWGHSCELAGLDYSDAGCRSLLRRAAAIGVDVSVFHADLFSPPVDLLGRFDIVYSLGLVEHFTELDRVLAAAARFLAPGGTMFTMIPNMRGIYGAFVRRFNRPVYDIHNPHDLRSFLTGHDRAGLEVARSGYLCSTHFGMLSACFSSHSDRGWRLYVFLRKITMALNLFESRVAPLPTTALFSPYLYAVSRIREESSRGREAPGRTSGR